MLHTLHTPIIPLAHAAHITYYNHTPAHAAHIKYYNHTPAQAAHITYSNHTPAHAAHITYHNNTPSSCWTHYILQSYPQLMLHILHTTIIPWLMLHTLHTTIIPQLMLLTLHTAIIPPAHAAHVTYYNHTPSSCFTHYTLWSYSSSCCTHYMPQSYLQLMLHTLHTIIIPPAHAAHITWYNNLPAPMRDGVPHFRTSKALSQTNFANPYLYYEFTSPKGSG